MSEKRLRGSRLGSISLESEVGVDFVALQDVTFRTADGEEFSVRFMEGVELPFDWTSPRSGKVGRRLDAKGKPIEGIDPNAPTPPPPTVTHWEQLLKRRTIPELEVILADRIAEMRASGQLNLDDQRRSA
ncbi:MAG: hypothetical protein RLZZ319_207 [Actinomycetota bacterium]|jgi:hypothetical protein